MGGDSPFRGQIPAMTGVTHPAQLCCEREASHVSREQMKFSQGIAAFKKEKNLPIMMERLQKSHLKNDGE